MVNVFYVLNIILICLLYTNIGSSKINKDNHLTLNLETDKSLYELIIEYRKKLFKQNLLNNLLFENNYFYNTSPKISQNNTQNISTKIDLLETQLYKTILLENKKIEGYFNNTVFNWENLKSFGTPPSERRGYSMVLSDTNLVLFGGSYMDTEYFNDLFFFDLISKNWIKINQLGDVPSPRVGHSCVLHGTIIWLFGGSSNQGYLNDLYSFNLETVK